MAALFWRHFHLFNTHIIVLSTLVGEHWRQLPQIQYIYILYMIAMVARYCQNSSLSLYSINHNLPQMAGIIQCGHVINRSVFFHLRMMLCKSIFWKPRFKRLVICKFDKARKIHSCYICIYKHIFLLFLSSYQYLFFICHLSKSQLVF